MAKEFKIVPLSLKEANEFVTTHHRHNKKTAGHKWSTGLMYQDELVGVAIVGRAISRHMDEKYTVEILRLCIKDPAPKNACSFLYSKVWRIWQTMGGKKIITYTLDEESGASMRAVGWKKAGTTTPVKEGKGWTNRGKGRIWQPVNSKLKYRWEKTQSD